MAIDLKAVAGAVEVALEQHPKPRSCLSCKHLSRWTESWEMPHIGGYECEARRGVENLKSWPWPRTRCASYLPRSK